MHPSETTHILFEQFVQELSPDYQQQAYDFGAFCRARKIKSPQDLLQIVMHYCGLDFSLRSCAGEFAKVQEYISDTAIKKRLVACTPWVRAMLMDVFGETHPVKEGHLRFVVIDGSTVQSPGAKGTSHRLHVAIDLVKLELVQVEITDVHHAENLTHYHLHEGDVVLLDRGYSRAKVVFPFIDRGGDVILRYSPNHMILHEQNDAMEKIEWVDQLKKLDQKEGVIPVYLVSPDKDKKRLKAYVHATPLPPEEAEKARRQARKTAKKKGYTPSAKTLYLRGWVLVLSSLPNDLLSTKEIATLYRTRWQVELVIKRLKSLLDIDCLRAKENSYLADLYLHGKLLYAAVIEKIARRRFNLFPTDMMGQRTHTPWRLWQLLSAEVCSWMISSVPDDMLNQEAYIKAIQERPRKRRLQTLPNAVCNLINRCRALGVSHA